MFYLVCFDIVEDRTRARVVKVLDHGIDVHGTSVGELMTRDCRTARESMLAVEALHMMEENRINALPVVDETGRLIGALNMHDLLRAGVV